MTLGIRVLDPDKNVAVLIPTLTLLIILICLIFNWLADFNYGLK